MNLEALRQPDQNTVVLVALAFTAALGAFSMMRPSPPRELPVMTRSSLARAAVATLPERTRHDDNDVDTGAWDDEPARLEAEPDSWDEPPFAQPDDGWDDGPARQAPDVALIGTSVSSNPDLHTAIFRYPERSVARFHHEGDRINGFVVESIGRREVVVRGPRGHRHSYKLSLYADASSSSPERIEDDEYERSPARSRDDVADYANDRDYDD